MKRKIKGDRLLMRIDSENEPIANYVDIIKPYFETIAHHHQTHHSLNKNAVLIYSYFPHDIDCGGCRQKAIGIKIPKITGNFPIRDGWKDTAFHDTVCSRLLQINYDDRVIGYYCVKNNVFMTNDFAHRDGNQPHVAAIFEHMYKAKILTVLAPSSETRSITLGTDPEMESIVQGKCVAGNRLPSFQSGNKAYISHDGARNQRELRPDPSSTPEELVDNIADLIRISSFLGEELSVRGNIFSLGGHIHIGGTAPSTEVITLLDYFLAPLNELNGSVRHETSYGKLGDFRYQPHGFEYRTPPAAWLLSPVLALKILQLTKVVVENLINGKEISIGDNNNQEEYKENLRQFPICTEEWINEFFDILEWAKHNLDKPLAKTWGVEVPSEYKSHKNYRYNPEEDPRPRQFIGRVVEVQDDTAFPYNERDNEINPDTGEPYD